MSHAQRPLLGIGLAMASLLLFVMLRELLNLKAEMPVQYVRREDYIRGQSVLEAKLDGLVIKLENVQLRAQQPNS